MFLRNNRITCNSFELFILSLCKGNMLGKICVLSLIFGNASVFVMECFCGSTIKGLMLSIFVKIYFSLQFNQAS